MTSESLAKFKEIVDRSQTFAVRCGKTWDASKILCAEILNQTLKKLGKESSSDINLAPENIKNCSSILLDLNLEQLNQPSIKENILVKFDTKTLPIKGLKYEKEGDVIKIILEGAVNTAGTSPTLDETNIKIEKERPPVDLLLLIDPQESEIEHILKDAPHKEVIKISSQGKALVLKIFDILKLLSETTVAELKNVFWFLFAEEAKINRPAGKEILIALADLADREIGSQKIADAEEALLGNSFRKLLGRALARSHYEKEISTIWSFLPKKDFERCEEKASSSLNVLNRLRILNPQSKFFALLWANKESEVNAIVAGRDATSFKKLADMFRTAPASSYFFLNSFETFSDAEIKIRNAVKKIISNA